MDVSQPPNPNIKRQANMPGWVKSCNMNSDAAHSLLAYLKSFYYYHFIIILETCKGRMNADDSLFHETRVEFSIETAPIRNLKPSTCV